MKSTLVTSFLFLSSLFCGINGVIVGDNPFTGTTLYVTSFYQAEVQSSINLHPSDATMLKVAQEQPTAWWIDQMAKLDNTTTVLTNAMAAQTKNGGKYAVVIIVYDLPDRDCAALASNGEITCADSTCAAGISEYETKYIDPLVTILKKFPDLTIIAVIEPDSLPNLATNLDDQKCSQAEIAYKTGTAYTLSELSAISNVAMYVDAAHGGWLGWPDNQSKFAAVIEEVFNEATKMILDKFDSIEIDGKKYDLTDSETRSNFHASSVVRGFASNTANYQPLGSLTSTSDPCNLESEGNTCINEAIYIEQMTASLESVTTIGGWITDTSRNGVTDMRSDCANWCNIKGAGIGERPTYNSSIETLTGSTEIDAFVWVKVPGESDGTSNTSSSRYDAHCTSSDSQTPAPEAGQWWDTYFIDLCTNAVPPLS